ncbi:hypothetical protein AVEN_11947-1 [Araneus ventricosus]|uniref:Uncharacterized protein n=1 Tax=Araneus ventricosus TaxID=182803 RepID=A0A4Y2L575_ARAVE|nr:hypothetical protein AVEN_11947-1 [Araneus ventricosus]
MDSLNYFPSFGTYGYFKDSACLHRCTSSELENRCALSNFFIQGKNHMGRDQANKLVVEAPKCDVLTGKRRLIVMGHPRYDLSRDGKFSMPLITSYALELYVFELDETCSD